MRASCNHRELNPSLSRNLPILTYNKWANTNRKTWTLKAFSFDSFWLHNGIYMYCKQANKTHVSHRLRKIIENLIRHYHEIYRCGLIISGQTLTRKHGHLRHFHLIHSGCIMGYIRTVNKQTKRTNVKG